VEFVNDLPPVVISPIADQTRGVDDPPFTADLNNVFADPEDGRLFFIAQAESSMVATATVDGSTLIVTPVAPGTTTITVTAFDDAEQDTTISFEFEVQPANGNQPPQVVGGVSDQFLPVRGDSVEVDLNGIFEDPEGDPLFFDASSSNENVVTVEIDNELGILTLIPGEEGIAVVTVFAFDSTGDQAEIRVRSVARGNGGTSSGGGATLGGGSGGGCALSGTASGRTDPLLWLLAGLATLVILRRRASPGRR
jgi:MYXO-CTERM domain-containing protein